MTIQVHKSSLPQAVRAQVLQRDGRRCTVARLLGGDCSDEPLHVHHIVPRSDGGTDDVDNLATACATHHPTWEALRRQLVRAILRGRRASRCPHRHRTLDARLICEARLARRESLLAA